MKKLELNTIHLFPRTPIRAVGRYCMFTAEPQYNTRSNVQEQKFISVPRVVHSHKNSLILENNASVKVQQYNSIETKRL